MISTFVPAAAAKPAGSSSADAETTLQAVSRSFGFDGDDLSKISFSARKVAVIGDCAKSPPARRLVVIVKGNKTVAHTVTCDGERDTAKEKGAKGFSKFVDEVLSKAGGKLARKSGLSRAEIGETRSISATHAKAKATFERAKDPPEAGAVKTIVVSKRGTKITRYGG